jgi:anti-sigma regulatory factor (Ser/Thr protein kinase)
VTGSASTLDRAPEQGFWHDACFYAGVDDFVRQITAFVREGLAAGEPTLVAVTADKISLLEDALGDDAGRVRFADMGQVGGNPAAIIPVWREFVDAEGGNGTRLRGIGEPVFPSRRPAELVECRRHESLLNVAFDDRVPWWLICPYDVDALAAQVVDEARTTHPWIMQDGRRQPSPSYRADLPDDALPDPPDDAATYAFGDGVLGGLRAFVQEQAEKAALGTERIDSLVLAVHELATNSLRHGGGGGTLRAWQDEDGLVFELRDRGWIDDPLAGRRRPGLGEHNGRGLWLVNRLCDLVQLRSTPRGTAVRLHLWQA